MLDTDNWNPDNTLKILIASDIHLGHQESDPVRGEDSFVAFEEVLALAAARDVDLLLLAGDLFDHAKPSPACMYKCTELIRRYCFGDRPVRVELLSDQLQNFARTVNYEDPNLNVSYPILSIHGNHDDPVGQRGVSSLDILSMTGLVNYFGKWSDYTQVRISPVLLQKGATRLALYGLSHLKDQRLARLFADQKVEMEMVADSSDWFNMLVLHQNRADRGPGNYIPEKVLPKFLDMVVWGHEHDSLVFPMKGEKNDDFVVVQPGSTVATSLAAGEALAKHCALLEVHKTSYKLHPIPLKTVRPFIFKTIVLSEEDLGEEEVNENVKVQEFLKSKVNEAIEEANGLRSGDPKQPWPPLVRLSVFYERPGQDFNRMRFGQNFTGLVANPNDVLVMKREKRPRERKETGAGDVDVARAAHEAADVEALLAAYYGALPAARAPAVLCPRAATEAVRDFTLKHDDGVFRRVFAALRRRAVDALMDSTAETDEEITDCLRRARDVLDATELDQLKMLVDLHGAPAPAPGRGKARAAPPAPAAAAKSRGVVVLSSDDELLEPRGGKATRSRGRGGRARGARGRAAASPAPEPAPAAVERRTPRRAAQKNSWLTSVAAGRANNRSSSMDDSD